MRVEARVVQALDADAVRLALEVAGVAQARLHAGRLCADCRADRKIGPRAAEQDRRG